MNRPSRPKRSLGQNFLTDPNYIRKIIEAVEPSPSETIVEIGPGRGALTERLIASGARVVAIELDTELARGLENRFGERQNLRVIEGDVLNVDLRDLSNSPTAGGGDPGMKLVANLPYYISTAILQRLAEQRDLFSELVLMFQREVVNRITAQPGSSERGYLTVIVETAFTVEKLFDVPPTAFSPRPKVWSSVVRLLPRPPNQFDEEALKQLIRHAFAQKRKTIMNNLKSAYIGAEQMLVSAGIDPKRRAETLTLREWEELAAAAVTK